MWIVSRSDDYLMHHGVLGQKWGIRRYQNTDGTLTEAGKERYGFGEVSKRQENKFIKQLKKTQYKSSDFNKQFAVRSKARDKMIKSKQMEALIDDDELRAKYDAAKKAADEFLKFSKGEDFDAFNPDKNGYDKNYGITTKQFKKILALDAKSEKAQEEFYAAVENKAKAYIDNHLNKLPSSFSSDTLYSGKRYVDLSLSWAMQRALHQQAIKENRA